MLNSNDPNASFNTPAGLEDVLPGAENPEEQFRNPPGFVPEAEPTPAPQPAPQPETQPEPQPQLTPEPTPEPTTEPEVVDYPTEVDPSFKPMLDLFKARGVEYPVVELVFTEAIETGDATKLNRDALKGLLSDTEIDLVLGSFEGLLMRADAAAQAAQVAIYDLAGGKDKYEQMFALPEIKNDATITAGLKSDNEAIRKLAMEKAMSLFNRNSVRKPAANLAPTQQQQAPTRHNPEGNPAPQPQQFERLSNREYAETLHKMRQSGEWDGANYAYPPVRALVKRLTQTANADKAREQAAAEAYNARMEAYWQSQGM